MHLSFSPRISDSWIQLLNRLVVEFFGESVKKLNNDVKNGVTTSYETGRSRQCATRKEEYFAFWAIGERRERFFSSASLAFGRTSRADVFELALKCSYGSGTRCTISIFPVNNLAKSFCRIYTRQTYAHYTVASSHKNLNTDIRN